MQAVDIQEVPPAERTQPAFDLFLIFAGANIVATTLVTGASLVGNGAPGPLLAAILAGSVLGAALVAVLAPVGPRLGVPSVVAARAVLGLRGAAFLALVLYLTNFAWIAFNNLIAASVLARALPVPGGRPAWVVLLGVLATVVVVAGPRAVALADRLAVPLMAITGGILTVRFLTLAPLAPASSTGGPGWSSALDLVVGYQVSWILMFADYSRYTASARRGAWAVFLGLALTSLWFMPLGLIAARAAGSSDPGEMVAASGLGLAGATLMALATVTTNFVNIYLSALAFKSLVPRAGDTRSIVAIGLIGTLLPLLPGAGLDQYVRFVELLGALFVSVGGVLIARLVIRPARIELSALYDSNGPYAAHGGVDRGALLAWALGACVYVLARPIGGTLPALATSALLALILDRRS